ncbi:MAG: MerR family transcriptional regulator [Myxococcota bacterium]|jgi:DNA-binding transcriptional MerR regulator
METADKLPDKIYFRIGEVAELLGVEPHVVRFWQQQFPTVRPERSAAGRYLYAKPTVERLLRIRQLLYAEGYTIAGAKRALATGAAGRGRKADAGGGAAEVAAPAGVAVAASVAVTDTREATKRQAELEAEVDRLRRDLRALTARLEASQVSETDLRSRLDGARARERAVLLECLAEVDNLAAALSSSR